MSADLTEEEQTPAQESRSIIIPYSAIIGYTAAMSFLFIANIFAHINKPNTLVVSLTYITSCLGTLFYLLKTKQKRSLHFTDKFVKYYSGHIRCLYI